MIQIQENTTRWAGIIYEMEKVNQHAFAALASHPNGNGKASWGWTPVLIIFNIFNIVILKWKV